MSTLINGKHYKQIVIEYYEELISQVDICAEKTLEILDDEEVFEASERDETNEILFHDPKDERFYDPYSLNYTLDDPVEYHNGVLVKDFVHVERMRIINEFKRLQKERLEELRLATTKPSSVEEALFGVKQFGFLVKINIKESDKYESDESMKFMQVAVVVDFYLNKDDVKKIE